MAQTVSRRSFLKGAEALGVAAVAGGALAGTALANEGVTIDEGSAVDADAKAPANPYVSPDGIGTVRDTDQEEDFDAVFVGTGIGGMMGAMIVAEQAPDAKVLLIDKRAICGGNTNFAERCAPQASKDWPTALVEGIQTAADSTYVKDGLLYAERAFDFGKNSGWMYLKHGLKLHKPASSAIARPMYEGGNGTIMIQRLQEEIETGEAYANIDLRLSTRATALLLDDDHTCTGVQILNADGTYTNVHAKAVVLATGGISNNFDLLQYYSGQDLVKCESVSDGQDGDGHLMAEQTAHGRCKTIALSSMYVHVKGLGLNSLLSIAASMNGSCCYVNQDGIRFIDESSPSDIARCKAIEQQGKVFSIMGTGLLNEYQNGGLAHMKGMVGEDRANEPWDATEDLEACKDNENVFEADTLEELAGLIGADPDTFVQTIEQYDADAEAGTGDSVLGKPAENMMAMGEGPYYAFRLSSVIFNTNNGIRVNRNAQVVDPEYNPIEGLYASGIAVSGFNTEVYYVGTCQSSSIWAGSKAARHLVEHCLGGTVADDWYGDAEWQADQLPEFSNWDEYEEYLAGLEDEGQEGEGEAAAK